MSRRPLLGMLTSIRRPISQTDFGSPEAARRALAEDVETMANTLADIVDHAAGLDLAIPPPVANTVHDLRGWAVRINYGTAAGPGAVDAGRVLAYLRGLSDQQLLALLADLPWARLDALLDAVTAAEPNPSGGGAGR